MTGAIRRPPEVAGGIEIEPVMSDNGQLTLWRTVLTSCGAHPHGQLGGASHDELTTSIGDGRDAALFCQLNYNPTVDQVLAQHRRDPTLQDDAVCLMPRL
ncbi:hypothetical protein MKK75_28490, partial [Methylobacterium sp. J-030]|uniref:hypothetical protein n=1 Tax=Methylobacterium sp. J-030 TaxID=2836627 RepID=UPI001FB8E7CE